MLTKFRTQFSKELMLELDELGFIDTTGYLGGGPEPEYIDIGYDFYAIDSNSGERKYLGIFESYADASRELTYNALLERARQMVERYDKAVQEDDSWLYSKVDTWHENMET